MKKTEPNFTAGEWKCRIDGTGTGRGPVVYVEGAYFDDGSEREICKLETSETTTNKKGKRTPGEWHRKNTAAEIEANARLLTAAKDLYDVAKMVDPAIGTLMDELGKGPAANWGVVNDCLCAAKKAIAKVEVNTPIPVSV